MRNYAALQFALEARAIAQRHCRTPAGTRRQCASYHASWPVLSLLEAVASASNNESFFVKYIRQTVRTKGPISILICGLADFEMLRVALQALSGSQEHKIFVVDSCPTPLIVARRYLEARQETIPTSFALMEAENIGVKEKMVDLVATDLFLNKVPHEHQSGIVEEWRRILKPNGEVITTVHLASGEEYRQLKADRQQVAQFGRRIASKAGASSNATSMTLNPDEAKKIAEEYANHNISYPISESALRQYFHGFDTELVEAVVFDEYSQWTCARMIAIRTEWANEAGLGIPPRSDKSDGLES